jgi:excisionase family DNA binding protein
MSTLPDKELLRVDEVAEYFSVSPKTIYLWIDHGHLIAEKFVGTVRIPRKSVIKLRDKKKRAD